MSANKRTQHFIGKPTDSLPTPAMVVEAEALDHNLALMAGYFAARHAKLRPHFKSHKCVTLALRQLAAGSACGITCAKLSEAEALVAGGVTDVLIANQVVGEDKAARLAELNRSAVVRAAVDWPDNIAQLAAAARRAGVTIGLLVEVDIGMNRCGVKPGQFVLDLARLVAQLKGLRLDGLQGYEGHLVMTPSADDRRSRTLEAMRPLIEMRRALLGAGLDCRIVSGGGTGTYDITGQIDGIDEIQAGSYALMDSCYRSIRGEFRCAMSVLATVISASPDRIVADVGFKGMGCEFGPPAVAGLPDAKVVQVAEEHAIIRGASPAVGAKLRLVPSHGCTTSNLHRRMWLVRGGVIEAMWPIEGSGCLE